MDINNSYRDVRAIMYHINAIIELARDNEAMYDEKHPQDIRRHQRIEIAATFGAAVFNLCGFRTPVKIRSEKANELISLIRALATGTFEDTRPLDELLTEFPLLRNELEILLEDVDEGYSKRIPFYPCREYTEIEQEHWPMNGRDDIREFVEYAISSSLMAD